MKKIFPLFAMALLSIAGCVAAQQSDMKDDDAAMSKGGNTNGLDFLANTTSLKGVSKGMSETNLLSIIHRQKLEYKRKQGMTSSSVTYYVRARSDMIVVFDFHEGFCWGFRWGLKELPGEDQDDIKPEACIDTQIEAWATSKTQLFLYTLEPLHRQDKDLTSEQFFHSFIILGKAEITDSHEKTTLLKSFAQGIREGASVNMCFAPRHGLRAIVGSVTNDFEICFECLLVHTSGFNHGEGFPISDSPRSTFEDLANRHHLKAVKRDE